MKKCKKCDEEKPVNSFYGQNKKRNDGTEWIYYRPDCKECTKKSAAKWQNNNIDRKRESGRNWARRNMDVINKRKKESVDRGMTLKKWQSKNKDKTKGYQNKRLNKNHDISNYEWEECKRYFDNLCAYCGKSEDEAIEEYNNKFHQEHVDHDGSNKLDNCIPSCKGCNSSKHQSEWTVWYNEDNPNFTYERLNKIHSWLNGDYLQYKE
ncbi:HNH endonuclease [Aquibacillus saliphilus]|uniref:HNH endonuclease n=1 Tax=Aquibacillus saliphilus TaxID=1909422 RepID=UPI001CEFE052|nr:HNH endonuclease [Aquibacillus saliphilus]